jgi:hypothetical protein
MEEGRDAASVERTFKSLFGCSIAVAYFLWIDLLFYNKPTMKGGIKHMLWTLCFLKLYPTEDQMSVWFNADRATVRKWVWYMLGQIAVLHHEVVSNILF